MHHAGAVPGTLARVRLTRVPYVVEAGALGSGVGNGASMMKHPGESPSARIAGISFSLAAIRILTGLIHNRQGLNTSLIVTDLFGQQARGSGRAASRALRRRVVAPSPAPVVGSNSSISERGSKWRSLGRQNEIPASLANVCQSPGLHPQRGFGGYNCGMTLV